MKGLEKLKSQNAPLSNGPALRIGYMHVEHGVDRGVASLLEGKLYSHHKIVDGDRCVFMRDYSSEIIEGAVHEVDGKLYVKIYGLDFCELFIKDGEWQRTSFYFEREETPD